MIWAQCQTRPVLMIPGPTELPPPVIQALNRPPAIQYDDSFDLGMLAPTMLALRDVFQTRNEVPIQQEPRAPRAGHPRPEPASRPPLQHDGLS